MLRFDRKQDSVKQLFFNYKINKLKTILGALVASLVAQMVKKLPAMQDTWVQSLDREDTLEKGAATHSSILAWEIPWTEEPGRLQSMGSQRVGCDLWHIGSEFPDSGSDLHPPHWKAES